MITFILSTAICFIYLSGKSQRNAQAFDSIASARHGLHSGLHASNIASTLAVNAPTISAEHSQDSNIAMVALPKTTDDLMSPLVQPVLLDLTVIAILLFLLHSIVLHPLQQLHIILPDVEGDPTGVTHRQQ